MSQLKFLVGGGETAALMRSHDWSESPLGPPDYWPQSLRTIVGLLLQSEFPMFVAWGEALGFLYNDAYAEILGAKHPRAMGRRFDEIWAEIWSDISPLIDAAMAGHSTYREDLPLVMNRKGYDEQTWFTFSYSPVRDDEGGVAGMFCAVQETTEKVLAERALRELNETLERRIAAAVDERRQAQKLESLGQLTGGVAHDFNNLLAVFGSGVQLLERDVAGPARQRIFDAMRRAVARGTGLTRHLLAFARRQPLNPESIDVSAQLDSMREMLERSLGGNVRVQIRCEDDLWPVEADAGEMELAVLNLCVNARDAMPQGGTIAIAVENVAPAGESEAREFVKLSVSDTGTGMSPDVLSRAFEPFFTTKDVSKGSGLGLPQVYGFAHQSGGRVTIDSEVGLGTTVTLLLPRSTRRPAGPKPADASRSASGVELRVHRGQVLLVEDDAEVSALSREMLTALGFSVLHVASAEAALGALANARAIDVVFSDIMMPGGVSGVTLAQEIARRHPQLPVVLTTGYIEAAAGIGDAGVRLLLKPYTLEQLAEVLDVQAR